MRERSDLFIFASVELNFYLVINPLEFFFRHRRPCSTRYMSGIGIGYPIPAIGPTRSLKCMSPYTVAQLRSHNLSHVRGGYDIKPLMPVAHKPTRLNWTVFAIASWRFVAFRRVVWCTGFKKTSFGSSVVVFVSSFMVIKPVWYYLVSSGRLMCGGHLKNYRRLKTNKNWTPNTSTRNANC